MSWLKFNNVTLTNGGVLVVITDGTSTTGIEPGYALIAHGLVYEIASTNNGTITLSTPYSGTTENNVPVTVQPTHSPIVNLLNSAIAAMQNYAGTPITPSEPTPDTVAPVIVAPNNISIQFANGAAGLPHNNAALVAWINTASGSDNVDTNLTVNNNLASLVNPLAAAIHNITFTTTDSAGNTGQAIASVTVSEALGQVVNNAPVTADQYLNINAGENLIINLAQTVSDPEGDTITYTLAGDTTDYTPSTASTGVFNTVTAGSYAITVTADDGTNQVNFNINITVAAVPADQAPEANPRTVNVTAGVSTVIVLGNATDNDTPAEPVTFTVTGSTSFTVGPATNEITYLSGAVGSETLSIVASDGANQTPYSITVNTAEAGTTIPTVISYQGQSTMMYTLEGQNTAASTAPSDEHNPSVYKMVGQMYAANSIAGYVDDFEFMPQGSEFIDGTEAQNHINGTAATVAVLSAYGSESGITANPTESNQAPGAGHIGWIDRMVNIVSLAEGRGITPIMYQCWGSAGTTTFDNALINSDALQAKKGMLIIRTAEIVKRLGEVNIDYITNTPSTAIFAAPVTHLYSGDPTGADSFHGSYAMAYMVALATFKTLTGISAADNAFVIPSGGNVGTQYGMSATFIADIKAAVDFIQKESIVSGLAEGAAPIAANFTRDLEQNIETQINIVSAASLLDDLAINTDNLALTTINAAYFSAHSLTNGILKVTPNDSYTGNTNIVFTYTDADSQAVTITLDANLIAQVIEPSQEIIIDFGSGDGSSFAANGNLYNHTTLAGSGKVVNLIRDFSKSGITQSSLQDTDGTGVGSVTSISSGVLSGGGYGANASPVVYHYGPYEDLYTSQSAFPNDGRPVEFSLNGFNKGDKYRIGMGGYWGSNSADNIIDAEVNGVVGQFNVKSDALTVYDHVATVDYAGRLVFKLLANAANVQSYAGLSYGWLNKITDNTPAETANKPVFTLDPVSVSAVPGDTVQFTCDATATQSFQWLLGGADINGKTANSYSRTIEAGDEGKQISVQANSPAGSTISAVAVISLISSAPSINTPLAATATVKEGDNLILFADVINGQTIQWHADGVDIAGQTSNPLNTAAAPSLNGKNITYTSANTIDSITSSACLITVTPLQAEYWFGFGNASGPVIPLTDTWNGSKMAGNGGQVINGFRMFNDVTANVTAGLQDTQGNENGLALAFSSIGSDTSGVNSWGTDGMGDVQADQNVIDELIAKSIFDHKELFSYSVYVESSRILRFEFSNGGLVTGETWIVQLIGMHYEDSARAVDVTINGTVNMGTAVTGPWANMVVSNNTATVDSNGKLIIDIAPQGDTNINGMRIMKVG